MNPETIPLIIIIIAAFIAAIIGFSAIVIKILVYKAMVSEHIRDMGEYRKGI